MASSVNRQDEPNPALWLATRAGKMEQSCPLGTTAMSHEKNFPESHIINPLLTKLLVSLPGVVDRTQSNLISIELNRTQSVDWVRLSSTIKWNRTHRKVKKSIEPNRTFDFRTLDLCKTYVENPLPDLRSSSYFSRECSARVFRKRRNSAEMASDALWIVSFKCIVKGYQECRFDVKDGEVFRVLKKIGEKGRAFRIANERGQLGHLQRELVASLWPVNASRTW